MSGFSYLRMAVIAAAIAGSLALGGYIRSSGKDAGRAEVQAKWDAEKLQKQKDAIAEGEANARETLRRMERQKENQNVQDKELLAARADAGRNLADADRLRSQNAGTAQRWRDALRDTPACSNCAPAADAIGVLADVLSRADRRAGVLADYADAARTAGLKCQRDYEALTPP